ncbi:MAG: hypothetical protein QM371_07050 [Bacillota bacterium]|jgi:hypothetical protein|nr:hypothetical protein [Bacillota bacterium]
MFVRVVEARNKKYAQVVEAVRKEYGPSHVVLWSLGRYDEAVYKSVSHSLRSWEKLERAPIMIREIEELCMFQQVKHNSRW